MAGNKPTPISEGAWLRRDRVLAIRERLEKLSSRLETKERDLMAEQKRLSMRAEDNIDWVIDENARLDEEINAIRKLQLELEQLMNGSFDEEEKLIETITMLEQRLAEMNN